jgi:hypothetical protein
MHLRVKTLDVLATLSVPFLNQSIPFLQCFDSISYIFVPVIGKRSLAALLAKGI